jgi:hypothetical protein
MRTLFQIIGLTALVLSHAASAVGTFNRALAECEALHEYVPYGQGCEADFPNLRVDGIIGIPRLVETV